MTEMGLKRGMLWCCSAFRYLDIMTVLRGEERCNSLVSGRFWLDAMPEVGFLALVT